MSGTLRLGWSAAMGGPATWLSQLIPYVFGLGSALLIGSAVRTPGAIDVATALWAAGDLAAVIGVANCLERFARSARDLRLPEQRATMLRLFALLTLFLVILPALSFRMLIPEGRPLIWATSLAPLGLSVPSLVRWVRARPVFTVGAAGIRSRPAIRSPADIVRMYLGAAFAPLPRDALAEGAGLAILVLWSVPPVLAASPVAPALRWLVPWYLGLSAALVHVWFMTSLMRFNACRPATLAELALLPGLGTPADQRRAFYRAALARPLAACGWCAALAMFWASRVSPAWPTRAALGAVLLFLVVLSACNVVSQLLDRPTRRESLFLQVFQTTYIGPILLVNCGALAARLPLAFFSSLALFAALLLAITGRSMRRLARLPHPFLT